MKTGALVLGIVGGLIALIYGLVGYGIGSLGSSAGAEGAGLVKLLSIGLPVAALIGAGMVKACLLYTSPSPRDKRQSRMPSSA